MLLTRRGTFGSGRDISLLPPTRYFWPFSIRRSCGGTIGGYLAHLKDQSASPDGLSTEESLQIAEAREPIRCKNGERRRSGLSKITANDQATRRRILDWLTSYNTRSKALPKTAIAHRLGLRRLGLPKVKPRLREEEVVTAATSNRLGTNTPDTIGLGPETCRRSPDRRRRDQQPRQRSLRPDARRSRADVANRPAPDADCTTTTSWYEPLDTVKQANPVGSLP